MKIGIILLARFSSVRLPGKVLSEIQGQPVLSHIVTRVKKGSDNRQIVVATSSDKSDDPIAQFCRRNMISCFRGDLNDVADRFISCAQSYEFDYAVRINCDSLFLDFDALRSMLAIADLDLYDFVTNVPGRTFPFGMSIEIVKTRFFSEITNEFRTSPYHKEHVTSWLYENISRGKRYVFENKVYPAAAGLHLALDTQEDLRQAETIFKRMSKSGSTLTSKELVNLAHTGPSEFTWRGVAGPMLIAEIGGNHEGDFDEAKKLTKLAIESGADVVKFQIYSGQTLVSPVESPTRFEHFQKFELLPAQHIELAKMCKDAGVQYLASVWSLDMLDWIDPYLDFYKIGSGDLTAWPLLEAFALKGKPILLSTGLATLEEVLQSIHQIQAVNPKYLLPEWLCVLQCTAMYPIPDNEANLRVIESLSNATGLAVGYSDHTVGVDALRTAAAMGASVLEFHFTDRRDNREFRDHKVSLVPAEVAALREAVAKITELRGCPIKKPQLSETRAGHEISFRRAAYLAYDRKKGDIITSSDIVYLRPAHGLDARDSDLLIGATVLKDTKAFARLQLGVDFSPAK